VNLLYKYTQIPIPRSFIVDIISVGLDRDFIVIGNINIRKIDNTAKKVTIPTIYVVFIILFYLIANAVK